MKVIVKVNDTLSVECSGDDDVLFKQMAEAQGRESILGDSKCGVCGKSGVKFVVRESGGYEFLNNIVKI